MKFYLLPLEEVENDSGTAVGMSQSTIRLCLAALIPAQYPEKWRYDLQELTGPQWEKAEDFVTTAILELTGEAGVIDGGNA